MWGAHPCSPLLTLFKVSGGLRSRRKYLRSAAGCQEDRGKFLKRNSITDALNRSGTSSYDKCPTPSKISTSQRLNSWRSRSAEIGVTAESLLPQRSSVGIFAMRGNADSRSARSRFHDLTTPSP